MEDKVFRLIEAEQVRRRRADAAHLQRLSRELGGDVQGWCATRRRALRVAAMALLLLLPGCYALLLPQRVDDSHVLCNLRGDEQLVVNRACSSLGNCGNRLVSNILCGGGTYLKPKQL